MRDFEKAGGGGEKNVVGPRWVWSFLDVENFIPLASPKVRLFIERLLKFSAGFGEIAYSGAFCSTRNAFSAAPGTFNPFNTNNFEWHIGPGSADYALYVDWFLKLDMKVYKTIPNKTVVLGSGDSFFFQSLQFAKRRQFKTVVVSLTSCLSKRLASVADESFYFNGREFKNL
jgi:uncharacterized LabA/DUF88 family protein